MNPQTPNLAPFFGRKISKTGINITQATDNQLILKEDYDQGNTIYYDDSGIPNVLIGKRPLTGVRGFYVAAPGIDVTKATDPQLIFNSQNDVFKIVESGHGTVTVGSGDTANTVQTKIPHGLDYVPIVKGFIQNPSSDIQPSSGEIQCPFAIYGDTTTGGHPTVLLPLLQYYYVGADSTYIYLNVFYKKPQLFKVMDMIFCKLV